jgi:hypothetical protein
VLLLVLASGAPSARAEPPLSPFSSFAATVTLGRYVVLPQGAVLLLEAPAAVQPGLAAQIGLAWSGAQVMAVPMPAGELRVRVANPSALPLEIPRGEVLQTPWGPSRHVARTAWLGPNAAAYVPVLHAGDAPPAEPYRSRGSALTPFEQTLEEGWIERVRGRNGDWGVPEQRRDDAGAAFRAKGFAAAIAPWRTKLEELPGMRVVGVAVFDGRGLLYAHVETDADRFADVWPRLIEGIALDGLRSVAERRGGAPSVEAARTQALAMIGVLASDAPRTRPALAQGTELRWDLADGTGGWEGLSVEGTPIAATLLRRLPFPEAPRGPTGGGGGGDDGPDTTPRPTPGRVRPTEEEERLGERRPDPHAGGAGARGTAPRGHARSKARSDVSWLGDRRWRGLATHLFVPALWNEEGETVGPTNGSGPDGPVCENDLRKEHGLKARMFHWCGRPIRTGDK